MNHKETETRSNARKSKSPRVSFLLVVGLASLVLGLFLLRRSEVTIHNGDGDFQVSAVELKKGPVFTVYYPDRVRWILRTVLLNLYLPQFAPRAGSQSIPVREEVALCVRYFSKTGKDLAGGPFTIRVKESNGSSQQVRIISEI